MRLQLLVILWFALTAWTGHAGASTMAHCQTHSTKSVAVKISDVAPSSVTNLASVQTFPSVTAFPAEITFLPANLDLPVNHIATSNQHLQGHAADPKSSSHDCCDEQNSPHQCGTDCVGCASCQGCGTLHCVAMPAVWQMTPAITQQKIQHLAYSYLNLQPATQERPPKR